LHAHSSLARAVTVDNEVATNSRTLHTLNVMHYYKTKPLSIMSKINLIFVFICALISTSCLGQKSELIDFKYQGYSDTIYALIEGQIFIENGFNKETIDSVKIVSNRPNPKDTIAYTDKNGRFLTGFCKGTFTVYIQKKGYQTIKLINYESDPDQVSRLKAILRKGNGEIVYDISKDKMKK
jgi:hypothetical protein